MIYIVHWRDCIGKDNLSKFKAIQIGVTLACQQNPNSEKAQADAIKKASGKITDADVEMWQKKRHQMKKCGYELDGRSIKWHGWFMPVVEGGELYFRGTADPTRRQFISMNQYLEWLNAHGEEGPVKTYNVKAVVNKTAREMERDQDEYYQQKDRFKKADPDFIPELQA